MTPAPLLAGVLANPGCDLARLVYADALEETGEPGACARAEFIRVQVGLAKWEAYPGERFDGMTVEGKRYDFMPTADPIRRERELWESDALSFGLPPGFIASRGPVVPNPHAGTAVIRRGFASEIHCPLAAWCGGECPTCRGRPYRTQAALYVGSELVAGNRCPACSGSGRVVGHGPALVRSHPVERVVLSDREPEQNQRGWCWWVEGAESAAGNRHPAATVPLGLDNYLLAAAEGIGAYRHNGLAVGYWLIFYGRNDALTALESTLLAWARSQPAPGDRPREYATADFTPLPPAPDLT